MACQSLKKLGRHLIFLIINHQTNFKRKIFSKIVFSMNNDEKNATVLVAICPIAFYFVFYKKLYFDVQVGKEER